MTRNKWIGVVVALVIVGIGCFFIGKSQAAPAAASGSFGAGGASGFAGRTGRTGAAGAAGAATLGKIVAVGSNNISIQLQNSSSSEIVLIGPDTQILKTISGSMSDLATGTSVTITGTSNSDGSLSANSIQIIPAGAAGRFGGGFSGSGAGGSSYTGAAAQ